MSRSETSPVVVERQDDGVATLTLCDAAGNNALSARMAGGLERQLEALAADTELRVVVLRGLPEVFCSGGDRAMLLALARGEIAATDIMLSRAVLEFPLPTIAAMEGHAVGGGLTLGICCDVVLMARESRYGCSFMNMGFTPGMGTTRLLSAAVGEHLAAEMMFGGQYFRGSRFAERTAINYVLPRAQVYPKALSVARRMAEKPRLALELLKRSLSLPRRQLFEQARTAEATMHERCFDQPDIVEAIEDHFASLDKQR